MENLNEIKDEMLSGSHRKRPNCQQIIKSMKDWTLNENEIKELKIFEEFEEKLLNENEFFVTFLKYKIKSTNRSKNIIKVIV